MFSKKEYMARASLTELPRRGGMSGPAEDAASEQQKHGVRLQAGRARETGRTSSPDRLLTLRTAFETMLARSGLSMRTAQQLMRHSDVRLTAKIYIDPAVLDLQGTVQSLRSVLSAAQAGGNSGTTQSSSHNTPILSIAS